MLGALEGGKDKRGKERERGWGKEREVWEESWKRGLRVGRRKKERKRESRE